MSESNCILYKAPEITNENLSGVLVDLVPPVPPEHFYYFFEEDFKLFWYMPVRAYPGLLLKHQFIVYETYNQPLKWNLSGDVQEGMILDEDTGLFTWEPPMDKNGQTFDLTVRVTRLAGFPVSLENSFKLSVNTTDFIFVSAEGDDTNSGTKDKPLRNIKTALKSLSSGKGKTVILNMVPIKNGQAVRLVPSQLMENTRLRNQLLLAHGQGMITLFWIAKVMAQAM